MCLSPYQLLLRLLISGPLLSDERECVADGCASMARVCHLPTKAGCHRRLLEPRAGTPWQRAVPCRKPAQYALIAAEEEAQKIATRENLLAIKNVCVQYSVRRNARAYHYMLCT